MELLNEYKSLCIYWESRDIAVDMRVVSEGSSKLCYIISLRSYWNGHVNDNSFSRRSLSAALNKAKKLTPKTLGLYCQDPKGIPRTCYRWQRSRHEGKWVKDVITY